MPRAIAIAVLLLGLTPGVARGEPWRWPVRGEVTEAFTFDPADPYRAGQRRGITIAAPPGALVRAACPGAVVFAGAVGRAGPTLSVRCGELRATYQGLADIGVEEGDTVGAGEPLARVNGRGSLRLGARRETAAGGYVDPATLLADGRPPLGPAARPPRRERPPAATAAPRPGAAPARAPAPAPLAAWLGAALLAAALPAGALRHARRRPARRRVPTIGGLAGTPRK